MKRQRVENASDRQQFCSLTDRNADDEQPAEQVDARRHATNEDTNGKRATRSLLFWSGNYNYNIVVCALCFALAQRPNQRRSILR